MNTSQNTATKNGIFSYTKLEYKPLADWMNTSMVDALHKSLWTNMITDIISRQPIVHSRRKPLDRVDRVFCE